MKARLVWGSQNNFKWAPFDNCILILVYQGGQGDLGKRLHEFFIMGELFPIYLSSAVSVLVLSDTVVSCTELALVVSSLL